VGQDGRCCPGSGRTRSAAPQHHSWPPVRRRILDPTSRRPLLPRIHPCAHRAASARWDAAGCPEKES
jgi:hypothetical protein